MMTNIERLLKNYGRTSDEECRELLKRITPVQLGWKGGGTKYGFYTFGNRVMSKVKDTPREFSYLYAGGKLGEWIGGCPEVIREIPFYVKSTSHLVCPDIGEIFDQMTDLDKQETELIYVDMSFKVVMQDPNEFLMHALLMKWKS